MTLKLSFNSAFIFSVPDEMSFPFVGQTTPQTAETALFGEEVNSS